jgi:periplasmic protein TonB
MTAHAIASPPPACSIPPTGRRTGPLAAVIAAHLLLIWMLLQNDSLKVLVREVKPLMVALISDASAPTPPIEWPLLRRPPPPSPSVPLSPWPAITVSQVPPAPPAPPAPSSPPPDTVAPAPAVVVAAAAPVSVAPTPAAATPPRTVAATAIRYRVPPLVEVPLASRRLGESGTVVLRVLVDALGLPRQVSLHRSSGHARLDEQALAAMRQARFHPQTDNGVAVESLVFAPLVYELE